MKFLLILLFFFTNLDNSPESRLKEGDKFLIENNYIEAIRIFSDLIHDNPELAQAHYKLGISKFKLANKFGMENNGYLDDLKNAVVLGSHEAAEFLLKDVSFTCYSNLNLEKTENIFCLDLNGDQTKDLKKIKHYNNLLHLNINNSKIQESNFSLYRFPSLLFADLSHNKLTHVDDLIGVNLSLRFLYLDNNNLTSLPTNINNLSNLKVLSLAHNHLTTIPESLNHLSQLNILDLSFNKLKSLPKDIQLMNNLSQLIIKGNNISKKDLKELQKARPNLQIIY